MSAIAIRMPTIYRGPGSNRPCIQRDPLPEAASQTWIKNTFVQLTGTGASAKFQRCAAAATAIAGLAPAAAVGTGSSLPPASLFGTNHYPFRLEEMQFEINATNTSLSGANIGANGVTYAGGGTNGVALAPGQQYGILTMTSGTYSGYQTLDVTNTTQKVFEIIALSPIVNGVAQLTTDNNPRLIVKIIASVIQG